MHEELREKCYAKCDSALKGEDTGAGFWTYVPSANKVDTNAKI